LKNSVSRKSINVKKLLIGYSKDPSFPSFVALVLLIIINVSIQPNFFSYSTVKSNFMTFTPLILASMAQGIIIISGSLDLSIGAGMSLLTCIMASMMTDSIINVILVIIIGIVAAVAICLFNGSIIGFVRIPPLISTFATSAIFFGLSLTIMPLPGGYVPKYFYKWYRGDVLGFIPVPIFILLIGIGIWLLIKRTAAYRYIYAVGGNENGAYSSGINVARIKVMAFLMASFFIALGGLSLILSTAIGDPRAGNAYTLNSIAAVVIGGISLKGGKGSVAGSIIGALILGLLINIIFFMRISSLYQNFARGMIIIIALSLATIPKLRETSGKII
jgi:ribose transport system permease protein